MDAEADAGNGVTKVGTIYVFGGATDAGNVATVLLADARSDGTLGAWKTGTPLLETRSYLQAVTGNGFVAIVGGLAPSGYATSTLVARILPSGLGDWTALGQFGIPRIRHAVALANDRLYVVGGTDGADAPTADVQVGPVTALLVGPWASTSTLPIPRSRTAVASTLKWIYVFGGTDSAFNPVTDVNGAPINADGTVGSFQAQPALPTARTHAQATLVTPIQILVTGGEHTAEVLVYDIDPALGSLAPPRATLALPGPTDHHATVRLGNHVYVIGGLRDAVTRLSDVLVGDLAPDGTITRWTPVTSLPAPLAYHSAVAF